MQLQLQRLWSMDDQWWRNGTAAPISKHVVVMTGYRRIGIPGHGVQVGLQAEEIPSFWCVYRHSRAVRDLFFISHYVFTTRSYYA